MFAFPLLRREDQKLRVLAAIFGVGLFLLLTGLWLVQIVYSGRFENNSRRQSMKRVEMPAIRGEILDRNGQVLAQNEPHYNAILYLEELQGRFMETYARLAHHYGAEHPAAVLPSGRVRLGAAVSHQLQLQADGDVVSNIAFQVGQSLQEPREINRALFLRHYTNYPYVPFELVANLNRRQVARFAEMLSGQPELELETEPVRYYPGGTLAAHLLGYVRRENSADSAALLPDYVGQSGLERVFDSQLRGQPGLKMVLVNSQNYRQREDIETPNEPGDNIYLTIDADVQRVAEKALAAAQPNARGAAVVLDVRNGDILTLASIPSFDPNQYVHGISPAEWTALNDPKLTPQLNRAVDGAYPPGSTFKIITALACLETGLNPAEVFDSPGEYRASPSARPIKDVAGAGQFDFTRAFYRSSNTYFIHYGLMAGLAKILEVARRFHLGEKTHFLIGPEVAGNIATASFNRSSAPDICIGQEVTTTPLQMAGLVGAIANGGNLYWPRVATSTYDPSTTEKRQLTEPGRLRDHIALNPNYLAVIRRAMLEDTEHAPDAPGGMGTAYTQFHKNGRPLLGDFRVAGKTGTAEVKSTGPNSPRRITWFASYGPYEEPRYAVVIMVEDGTFGGPTCAPVAEKIYEALIKREQSVHPAGAALARD